MSRESKILQAGPWGAQATITHYESFGWELLSLNGNQITMSRETQDEVYPELVKHQTAYEDKLAAYQSMKAPVHPQKPHAPMRPAPFKLGLCLILLLIGIVPGALYIAYKVNKNNEYKVACEAHREACEENSRKINQMDAEYTAAREALRAEMDAIATESHAIFFSKRG